MERYLRAFVNYFQDDWVDLLPAAEFAANSTASATTKLTPFEATRGVNPRMSFHPPLMPNSARERLAQATAISITDQIKRVWDWAKSNIAKAQSTMQKQANKHRRDEAFMVGDFV